MNWSLDGIRVFVDKYTVANKQIIARLQPLAGGTVQQIFGYEGNIDKIGGTIVGNDDKNAIRALARSGNSYTLVSPEVGLGDYFVSDVQLTRVQCICQTLRPDLDADSPVFTFEITLFRDA